ncbi:hypothetical protein [Streptosporangium minutum]|uniref:Uncharacterized protein n=1 Tax=Streptosporangium minutum TaxID=569862 RepID=A0A243QMZ2_9ACTN|nr:hypothetical protein [Streptosporangium minutum]OUC83459.1 hypothetical protein CA984_40730 [Streptosporangium minutum]
MARSYSARGEQPAGVGQPVGVPDEQPGQVLHRAQPSRQVDGLRHQRGGPRPVREPGQLFQGGEDSPAVPRPAEPLQRGAERLLGGVPLAAEEALDP